MRRRSFYLATMIGAVLLASPGLAQQSPYQDRPQGEQDVFRGGGDMPRDEQTMRLLQREFEIGNLGLLPPIFLPATPRYLVTYMNSQRGGRTSSATVVSVTNQSPATCRVAVAYFKGFSTNASPVCSTVFAIPADMTVDYCSRNLPGDVTTCNAICAPELTFDEGRAIVSATCREIGVSARVYYMRGDNDNDLAAVTDSNIVRFGQGNRGD
jgi:hypothetical protein